MKTHNRNPVWVVLLSCLLWSGQSVALNDPTRPPSFEEASAPAAKESKLPLTVSMILLAKDRRVAVLNGQSLQVVESVDGYRVLRIERSKVVVSHKGKVKEVFLGAAGQSKTTISN